MLALQPLADKHGVTQHYVDVCLTLLLILAHKFDLLFHTVILVIDPFMTRLISVLFLHVFLSVLFSGEPL